MFIHYFLPLLPQTLHNNPDRIPWKCSKEDKFVCMWLQTFYFFHQPLCKNIRGKFGKHAGKSGLTKDCRWTKVITPWSVINIHKCKNILLPKQKGLIMMTTHILDRIIDGTKCVSSIMKTQFSFIMNLMCTLLDLHVSQYWMCCFPNMLEKVITVPRDWKYCFQIQGTELASYIE